MDTADSTALLTPPVSLHELVDGTTPEGNQQLDTVTNAVTSPTPISQVEQSQDNLLDSGKKMSSHEKQAYPFGKKGIKLLQGNLSEFETEEAEEGAVLENKSEEESSIAHGKICVLLKMSKVYYS